MRPEDLKSPFSWAQREVMIHDHIWYVPPQCSRYDTFQFPGWNHELTFTRAQPVHIEYCSGNGAWIAEKALQHPNINWVAVERKFDRVRKIWAKIKNHRLENLLILCGEGFLATQTYFPKGTISEAYVNFPDPWPKKRHAKHRIIQKPFVEEISRILVPNGSFTLVTDDNCYSKIMIQTMNQCSDFDSFYPEPYYVTDFPDYGSSYFEDLWRDQGKKIHYHRYQKKGV